MSLYGAICDLTVDSGWMIGLFSFLRFNFIRWVWVITIRPFTVGNPGRYYRLMTSLR
jgi:hypothetical protein